MTDKKEHIPGCEALGGYGQGIGPCSCREAQPEALRLANRLDCDASDADMGRKPVACTRRKAAAELRRQHAEIQQLKAEKARLQPTIEDDSQEWAKCDPAIAFHLIERHSDNWADAGKMMTEFAEAKAEVRLKALRDELTTQTNRAAAAEQQVTALTQRLDMANRLNTDARNLLAQQAASERLAKAFPQAAEMFHPLYVQGFKAGYRRGGARGKRSVLRQVGKLVDEVIAAPPPPEQEPRTNEWHHNSRVESAAGIRDALSRMGVYLTITTILQLVDITRKAHEIGATND